MLALNVQEASELLGIEFDIENIRPTQWQQLTSTICDESRNKQMTCNILQVYLFTHIEFNMPWRMKHQLARA